MAKPLKWKRQQGATYAWALGLHYYAERDESEWEPCCMINDADIWVGPLSATRVTAETAMQAHFDAEVSRWIA